MDDNLLNPDQFPSTSLRPRTPNPGPVRRRINVERSHNGSQGTKTGIAENVHIQTDDVSIGGVNFPAGVYHQAAYVPKISLNRAAMPHHN